MKRILNILVCTALAVFAYSCQTGQMDLPLTGNDDITLSFSSKSTKAADTGTESYIDHVDVLIFNCDESSDPTDVNHYERIAVNGASSSILTARRPNFAAGGAYYVQVIANSKAGTSAFEAIADYDDLVNMLQEDIDLHLTGLNIEGAPDYFLMDGVAYTGTRPEAAGPVVLNNGVYSENTDLTVNLERAAAKVEVIITAGDAVTFTDDLVSGSSGIARYSVRNLPYETFVIDHDPTMYMKLNTTGYEKANGYFGWNPAADPKSVSLVTYVYAHNWKNQSILEKQPSVVMNLPLYFTENGEVKEYPDNWYKVPMSADYRFDRNMYYRVEVKVNRPGASSMDPTPLGPINYLVTEWSDVTVTVGNDVQPQYLFVNRNELEMYNVSLDEKTLDFYSSSNVTVTVSDVYYYDKFGQKTSESASVIRRISGTTEGLSGKVIIESPVPVNNTIRYFTLTLTNETGQTQVVTVKQYPLEYIVNIQAWYSYRTDFNCTYETRGDRYVSTSGYNPNTDRWTYSTTQRSTFFNSKYAVPLGNGTSNIIGYEWGNSAASPTPDDNTDNNNARMYHVRITASSGEYKLGRPRITNGITDGSADNATMVSPSFMIASQLGAVYSTGLTGNNNYVVDNAAERTKMAASHCYNYVEVYKDPVTGDTVHLDDWRLPTEAELRIIAKFQRINGSAIDLVLGGRNYYSASGPIDLGQGNNGTFLRCIRDAY